MATPQRVNAAENGFSWNGASWDAPTPTPQAVASFSAASPSATLGTNGLVAWFNNTRINEEIPNSGGLRGWRWGYAGNPDPEADGFNETRYTLLIPQTETYEYFRMWQPSNFALRAYYVCETVLDASNFSDWVAGDTITTNGGNTATFEYAKDIGGGETRLFFKDNTSTFPDFQFPVGAVVTNDNVRATQNFTVSAFYSFQSNNKFSSQWVDDGGAGQGYENGAFTVQTIGTPRAGSFNPSGRLIMGTSAGDNQPDRSQVPNTLPSPPLDPLVVLDTAYNGSPAEFVIRRKRGSGIGVADGGYQIWYRGNALTNWTLVYENLGLTTYSTSSDNKFTHGYFLGYANSGFTEQTTFYLMDWQLWLQKPTFLP